MHHGTDSFASSEFERLNSLGQMSAVIRQEASFSRKPGTEQSRRALGLPF